MKSSRLLTVEQLEERHLLHAVFGVPWPDPEHLTLSFAPDGTLVSGQKSSLFQNMDNLLVRSTWQKEILRAYQTWAVNANINIGLVPDGGQPLGASGAPQGDARFGDFRIAGYPLPGGMIAAEDPSNEVAGTFAGDAVINTGDRFTAGGGAFDLFSVMLHEAGHGFGFDHSTDPADPMYPYYNGIRTGLTAADLAELQGLYGVRAADDYEGNNGNDTAATTADFKLKNNVGVIVADVTTLTDVDYFQLKGLPSSGSFSVQVQTTGLSLLTPKLTVYQDGTAVGTATASGPNNDLTVTVASINKNSTYYVRVECGTTTVFGIGAYRLAATAANASAPAGPQATPPYDDLHTDDTQTLATNFNARKYKTTNGYSYSINATVADSTDVDYYKFKASGADGAASTVMTVMVWPSASSTLDPRETIYDNKGNVVAATVLVNDAGSDVLQVTSADPNSTYYVAVRAANPQGTHNTGAYYLGIRFGPSPLTPKTIVTRTLTSQTKVDVQTLTTGRMQLYHFLLSAATGGSTVESAVRLTVFDANKNILYTGVAVDGDTNTTNLFLPAGTYDFVVVGGTKNGLALPNLTYQLANIILGQDIGPALVDSSNNSSSGSNPPPDDQWSGGGSSGWGSTQGPY